jgi:flagellar motility protein MotE (MotC chaperone)
MTKNANTIKTSHTGLSDYASDTMSTNNSDIYTLSSGAIGAIASATGSSYNWNIGANGNTAVDWTNSTIINSTITSSPTVMRPSGRLELNGESADIKINGRSLMDAIAALEERLNILVPNPELEDEWDELRKLGERYRKLEKKCKEKGEMWNKLKQMPPPKVG